MNKIIVFCGNVSSGKSTLAKTFSNHFYIPWHSSDAIREELSGDVGGKSRGLSSLTGKPFDVFVTLKERIEKDIKNSSVVVESTGMAPSFRADLTEWKKKFDVAIIKLTCDKKTWETREALRADRVTLKNGTLENFKMPEGAFFASSEAITNQDLGIDTSSLAPEEIFIQVLDFLEKRFGIL